MSREIKFRGRDLDGRWFYGLPCIVKEGKDKGSYISSKSGMPMSYAIRPETLTQFTGLLDKNGKEIYEGDILNVCDGFKTEPVIFYDGAFWISDCKNYAENLLYAWGVENLEIIGNIYENTELMDGAK